MPRHACSARCGARRRSGLGGLGRRRACQSGRLSPRHCVLDTRRHAAGRAHACGYVDNARALSTYPQAQQPTISINLITSESQGSDPARHIQANVSPGSRHTSPASLRHLCADSDSHSHLGPPFIFNALVTRYGHAAQQGQSQSLAVSPASLASAVTCEGLAGCRGSTTCTSMPIRPASPGVRRSSGLNATAITTAAYHSPNLIQCAPIAPSRAINDGHGRLIVSPHVRLHREQDAAGKP